MFRGDFWMSAGWAERGREARRSERWGVGERKAPTAQILLAALLYSTITQKPLDHIWDVLVMLVCDLGSDSALVGPAKYEVRCRSEESLSMSNWHLNGHFTKYYIWFYDTLTKNKNPNGLLSLAGLQGSMSQPPPWLSARWGTLTQCQFRSIHFLASVTVDQWF